MKIIDLLNARPVLESLAKRKMPARLAYAIAKNIRLIAPELEDYDQARMKLLSANWELDTVTNKFKVPDEEESKWKSMHDELLQTESDYKPYTVAISFSEQVEWTPAEFLAIEFIFDGEWSK